MSSSVTSSPLPTSTSDSNNSSSNSSALPEGTAVKIAIGLGKHHILTDQLFELDKFRVSAIFISAILALSIMAHRRTRDRKRATALSPDLEQNDRRESADTMHSESTTHSRGHNLTRKDSQATLADHAHDFELHLMPHSSPPPPYPAQAHLTPGRDDASRPRMET
ncbi:hypothetical protein NLI96_g4994 [Meripilus lineatus]|uniref:Uncharacterized protein n=1 Tax=Meripilus lineatus TaxID=2056292 RepID=A0AAD5YJD8_9APHY|nr:hypothetical protein NLI96_g4994 [Physisporinus lineatus]